MWLRLGVARITVRRITGGLRVGEYKLVLVVSNWQGVRDDCNFLTTTDPRGAFTPCTLVRNRASRAARIPASHASEVGLHPCCSSHIAAELE